MAKTTSDRFCKGKRPHQTRAKAQKHLDQLVARGTAAGALETYECRACGMWHVGHRLGRTKWRPQ